MIFTENDSLNNVWLTDVVSFEIWFGSIHKFGKFLPLLPFLLIVWLLIIVYADCEPSSEKNGEILFPYWKVMIEIECTYVFHKIYSIIFRRHSLNISSAKFQKMMRGIELIALHIPKKMII